MRPSSEGKWGDQRQMCALTTDGCAGMLTCLCHLITRRLLSFRASHLWLGDGGPVLRCQPCVHLRELCAPRPGWVCPQLTVERHEPPLEQCAKERCPQMLRRKGWSLEMWGAWGVVIRTWLIPFISEIGNNLLRPPHPCVFKFGNPKLSLKIICREWRVLNFRVGRK